MIITTDNLRVDNPCPFVPTRMNKAGADFFCKSCSRKVIDYRGKSVDEIKCSISKDICGIFTHDQLPAQHQMKYSRRLLFYCFTILSVLGFSVRPFSAQAAQTRENIVLVKPKPKTQNSIQAVKPNIKKTDVKAGKKEKKKKYRVVGCPSF